MNKKMRGSILLAMVIFASQLIFSPLARSEEKSLWHNLNLEVYAGSYTFPAKMIIPRVEKSITKSPDHFTGLVRGARAGWSFSKNWSLALDFFKVESHGYGRWERDDTPQVLANNNVAGAISGRTDWDIQGIILEIGCRFRANKLLSPYLMLGGGIAQQTTTFNGIFAGHETQSGFDFPVVNGAADRVVALIPVAEIEVGVRLRLRKNLSLSPSLYSINGGYGSKLGLSLQL